MLTAGYTSTPLLLLRSTATAPRQSATGTSARAASRPVFNLLSAQLQASEQQPQDKLLPIDCSYCLLEY
jgi:hypothetical protein